MSLRANLLAKKLRTQELQKEKAHSIGETIGLLRAVVVGGALFASLSIPLMLNIQAQRYTSEVTSMNLKVRNIKAKIVSAKSSISLLMETYFPNAHSIEIDGKKFYIRNK